MHCDCEWMNERSSDEFFHISQLLIILFKCLSSTIDWNNLLVVVDDFTVQLDEFEVVVEMPLLLQTERSLRNEMDIVSITVFYPPVGAKCYVDLAAIVTTVMLFTGMFTEATALKK